MEQFFGFALPGVPFGCTYALVAICLCLTYQATGVFNFAFGAQAFASGYIFAYLTEYQNWSGFEAFLVTVVVMGPFMGWAFDRLIFRHIANSNSSAKMVCSLALLVGIPSLMPVFFGNQNLDATATILPFFDPNTVYFTCVEHGRSTASTCRRSRSRSSSWFCSRSCCATPTSDSRCAPPSRADVWCNSTVSTRTVWSPSPGWCRASWPAWSECYSLRSMGRFYVR